MGSGLTYAGIGLALFIAAGVIQAGAQAQTGTTPAMASSLQKGSKGAAMAGFAIFLGFMGWLVPLLAYNFSEGQAILPGIVCAAIGAGIGYALPQPAK